jgi:hypothetical protein
MSLERAVDAARRLRDALACEVAAAREERLLLKRLDSTALFARAAARAHFLAEIARLERQMALGLSQAASTLRLPDVSMARLEQVSPDGARQLAAALDEVRALAGALREIDQLNASLAQRALACVRGYVDALAPAPRAYGRAGARAAAPVLLTVSTRG